MLITLSEAARLSGGVLHPDSDGALVLRYVCADSREALKTEGPLFAAIRGERTDGGLYVGSVLDAGGAALVSDRALFVRNTILVDDVRKALARLAGGYRRERLRNVKCVCITGSVGKTTTKDMTALVLAANRPTYATVGNMNSRIGLPLSVLRIPEDARACVLEIGMSEPGEIAPLSEAAAPDIAVVTNIGSSHIQAFGSREGICLEKMSIVNGLRPGGTLILNGDEPLLTAAAARVPHRCIFTSVEGRPAQYRAESVVETDGVTRFTIAFAGGRAEVALPALGLHNVRNALTAFAVGVEAGVPAAVCVDALAGFVPSGSRQNVYEKNGLHIIADCYNASPESMTAARSVLRDFPARRIAVLRDMLELGSHTGRLHRELGGAVREAADLLFTLGEAARQIAEGAAAQGMLHGAIQSFPADGHEALAAALRETLRCGDSVLFKASNRMDLKKVIELTGIS